MLGSGRSPHASARPRLVGGSLRARPWLSRRARWGARHAARLRRDPRGDVRRPELGRGTRRFGACVRLADRRRRPRCTASTRIIASAPPIPNSLAAFVIDHICALRVTGLSQSASGQRDYPGPPSRWEGLRLDKPKSGKRAQHSRGLVSRPKRALETSSLPGLAFDGPHRHRWL